MTRNKRPRKAYRPRPVVTNTLDLALHHAAKPAAADRDEVLGILRQAIRALREGVATEQQWSIVAGSVSVAQAIERGGIVRGPIGPEAWDVCFTAKVAKPVTGKAVAEFQSFHVTELEVEQ